MTLVHIKNCGLTSRDDINAAIQSGADYIGLVHFPKSPRHLELSEIQPLLSQPLKVKTVLLLVNPTDELLEEILKMTQPDYIQLHGDESPERVADIKARFNIPIIKALGISDKTDIQVIASYETVSDMLLLDAKPPKNADIPGGRGEAFDWTLLRDAEISIPWFLAGGLYAGNVEEAVRISGAKMVDVSSGIELRPSEKDVTKIAEFNRIVKAIT